MPTDKKSEPVEVEVLPKDWDQQKPARQWQAVDLKSPMTWLLIFPAVIFAFGLILYALGNKLQKAAEPDDQE